MREKLLLLMKNEGLTSSRLAELLGIRPSGISHILSGRNNPSFELVQKILRRFPDINPDWLLLDQGEMYRQQSDEHIEGEQNNINPTLGTSALAEQTTPITTSAPQANTPIQSEAKSEQPMSGVIPIARGRVKRVIVLYDDHTFESYEISR